VIIRVTTRYLFQKKKNDIASMKSFKMDFQNTQMQHYIEPFLTKNPSKYLNFNISDYQLVRKLSDTTHHLSNFCVKTKLKEEEICIFDKNTISRIEGKHVMEDYDRVNKWMIEEVKFNTHREPNDIVSIQYEADI